MLAVKKSLDFEAIVNDDDDDSELGWKGGGGSRPIYMTDEKDASWKENKVAGLNRLNNPIRLNAR